MGEYTGLERCGGNFPGGRITIEPKMGMGQEDAHKENAHAENAHTENAHTENAHKMERKRAAQQKKRTELAARRDGKMRLKIRPFFSIPARTESHFRFLGNSQKYNEFGYIL